MSVIINDLGLNNIVSILEGDLQRGSCVVELHGNDNHVEIATPHFWDPRIKLTGNATVRVGAGCVLAGLSIFAGLGSQIKVGPNTGFVGVTGIAAHEPLSITLEEGCLIADETYIMSSDMHSVIDRETGKRINPARDVEIGPRVWLGFRSVVLEGSMIGEGAIIGAGTVVSDNIPPSCAAAGNPSFELASPGHRPCSRQAVSLWQLYGSWNVYATCHDFSSDSKVA